MTREEAIAELREDKALYESDICHAGDGTPDGRLLQALDMAIEALHREEAEEKGYCHRIRPKADAEPTETSTLGEKHQLSHGRLIDADELKKHLDGAWEELNDDGERKGVRLARWYLISAPTVDSTIDVVRCKDCDNFDYTFNYCNFLDAGVEGEDFFCAYGERREK